MKGEAVKPFFPSFNEGNAGHSRGKARALLGASGECFPGKF